MHPQHYGIVSIAVRIQVSGKTYSMRNAKLPIMANFLSKVVLSGMMQTKGSKTAPISIRMLKTETTTQNARYYKSQSCFMDNLTRILPDQWLRETLAMNEQAHRQ